MYLLGPQDLVHCFDAGAGQEMQGEGQECARKAELTFLEWKVMPERVVEEDADILCSVGLDIPFPLECRAYCTEAQLLGGVKGREKWEAVGYG